MIPQPEKQSDKAADWPKVFSIGANIATILALLFAAYSLQQWRSQDRHDRAMQAIRTVLNNLHEIRLIAEEGAIDAIQRIAYNDALTLGERAHIVSLGAKSGAERRNTWTTDVMQRRRIIEYTYLDLSEKLRSLKRVAQATRTELVALGILGAVDGEENSSVFDYLDAVEERFSRYHQAFESLYHQNLTIADDEYPDVEVFWVLFREYMEIEEGADSYTWPLTEQANGTYREVAMWMYDVVWD